MKGVLGGRRAEVKMGFVAALRCGSKVQLVRGLILELGGAGKAVQREAHNIKSGSAPRVMRGISSGEPKKERKRIIAGFTLTLSQTLSTGTSDKSR